MIKRIINRKQMLMYFDPETVKSYDTVNTPKSISNFCRLIDRKEFFSIYGEKQLRIWNEYLFGPKATFNKNATEMKDAIYSYLYKHRQMFDDKSKTISSITPGKQPGVKVGRPKRMLPYRYTIKNTTLDDNRYSPQALQIMSILDKLGPGVVYENQLASFVREAGIIQTCQDPWKIFRNYQSELKIRGHIDYEIIKDEPI